jgi:hypothetical protein
MSIKRFLTIAMMVVGLIAAAVLLFFAGDHDETYQKSAPPTEQAR